MTQKDEGFKMSDKAANELLNKLLSGDHTVLGTKKELTAEQREGFSAMVYIYDGLVDAGMSPLAAATALGSMIATASSK